MRRNDKKDGQCKTDNVCSPTHFCSPGGTPEAIATKMRDAVTGSDLCPCVKCQPNPVGSFGGNASRTHRQTDGRTDRQTANLMSRPKKYRDISTVQGTLVVHPPK